MAFYSTLKQKSTCYIIERPLNNTAGRYHRPGVIGATGRRDGPGRIEIHKTMPMNEKIGTLAHEIGHERCHIRGCQCYKNRDWVLNEVHAELYALHLLLRNRHWIGIQARINRLRKGWNRGEHVKARTIIYERRIYKRCQKFLRNKKRKFAHLKHYLTC